MKEELMFAQFGRLFELTARMASLTKLPCIHIVPAELVGRDVWEATEKDGVNEFNAMLGAAASSIISRELQTMFTLKSAREGLFPNRHEPLRIGVAGGQATYFTIDGMPVLDAGSFKIKIAPLVIGSVPQHRYSAGANAEMMASKITYQATDPGMPTIKRFASVDGIEEWSEEGMSSYNVKIRQDILKERTGLGLELTGFFDLDYVLVGIGQHSNEKHLVTNLSEHIKTLYNGKAPDDLMGDVCSRLFNSKGNEIDYDRQDRFVTISFRALELLVQRKTPVIAVAGGLSKVKAINTIAVVRNSPHSIINGLITDELTAMQLLNINSRGHGYC
ncbi:MAG: sugar-binding domain-containing protein [Phycisphaerae bacterium]